ncbi:hypothetical protein FRC06_008941, partial [Ceratobasidium sp. 370]
AKGADLPDIPKILRLLEEFGDLPSIIDEHGISPGELWQDIELVLRTRRSVYGEPAAEAESTASQTSSPELRPVSSQSNACLEGHVSTTSAGTSRTPGTTNPPTGLATIAEVNSAIVEQLLRQCDELCAKGARFDRAMEKLTGAIDSAPRWEDGTLKSDAPVAGSSVERWKTEMRALGRIVTGRDGPKAGAFG